jgi:hypothetical protein
MPMNKIFKYLFPTVTDLELDEIKFYHTSLPKFVEYNLGEYTFKPFFDFGKFLIAGYFTDGEY